MKCLMYKIYKHYKMNDVHLFQFLNDEIYKQNIIVNFIIQKLKKTHFPPKVYKLSKPKFSQFGRTRGDKKQIFRTLMRSQTFFWVYYFENVFSAAQTQNVLKDHNARNIYFLEEKIFFSVLSIRIDAIWVLRSFLKRSLQ